ncbi:MAG: ATPase, T2SS/T4P/T4SS family [Gemmataceae bacterium]
METPRETPDPDLARRLLSRSSFILPTERLRDRTSPAPRAAEPAAPVVPLVETSGIGYLQVKARLHHRVLDELDQRNLFAGNEETLSEAVNAFVAEILETEDLPLNQAERQRLARDLVEETIGVGPLAPLMVDPAITDILVNGPDAVYIERFGRIEKTEVRFRNTDHLLRIIQRIAARVGRRIDESSPMVDARLPDGSRVNATLPPATLDGPTLSIRRFGRQRLRRSDLIRLGMMSPEMSLFLEHCVRIRKNLLISGGTGAGKSTYLGALSEAIPPEERIITIEDAAELILDQPHVIRMETRPINVEGKGRIVARDLVVNSLRMRPDRIIVGEVRGPSRSTCCRR